MIDCQKNYKFGLGVKGLRTCCIHDYLRRKKSKKSYDKASKNDKEKSKENVTGSCLWVKLSPLSSLQSLGGRSWKKMIHLNMPHNRF